MKHHFLIIDLWFILGYFDQQTRSGLSAGWAGQLARAGVAHRADLARQEWLAAPEERLRWQQHRLPSDELCTENAVMLRRFNRFPLVVDPSGQAVDFLMAEHQHRKITKTR